MSVSITSMRSLIAECRAKSNNCRGRFNADTIAEICLRLELSFLIDSLVELKPNSAMGSAAVRALEHLRSFGADSGEFYFAQRLRPSIVDSVVRSDARPRWIKALIEQGSDEVDAFTMVVDRWLVEPWEKAIDRQSVECEYRVWLKKRNKLVRDRERWSASSSYHTRAFRMPLIYVPKVHSQIFKRR